MLRMIRDQGVEAYEGSVRYVCAAHDAGLHPAVVSSSTNCRDVMVAGGIEDPFGQISVVVVSDLAELLDAT